MRKEERKKTAETLDAPCKTTERYYCTRVATAVLGYIVIVVSPSASTPHTFSNVKNNLAQAILIDGSARCATVWLYCQTKSTESSDPTRGLVFC